MNPSAAYVDARLAEMEDAAKSVMRWYQDKLRRVEARAEAWHRESRRAWTAALVTAGALVLSLAAHVWRSM